MPRTFVICKPDAVERGLVGEIITRLERKGLTLSKAELRHIERSTAEARPRNTKGNHFSKISLRSSRASPAMLMVVDGPSDAGDDTFAIVRNLMGATNPATAAPGTIRGDFGLVVTENLVHGSDSDASAEREIALFFPGL